MRYSTPTSGAAFVSSSPISTIPWPMVKADAENGYVFATRLLRSVDSTVGSVSVSVGGSGSINKAYSGSINAARVNITEDGTPPNTPIYFGEAGTSTPGTPHTCAQGPEGFHLESGFQIHTDAAVIYPEAPAKAYPTDNYHGFVNAVDNRGWAQMEYRFNGKATVTSASQSVEWLVLHPGGFGMCFIVPSSSPKHNVSYYDYNGRRVYTNTSSTGNNDPDGTAFGVSTNIPDVATVVLTFDTRGVPPIMYPVFMYEGSSIAISKITFDEPETYRISSIHTGSPNFHAMTIPDNRFPLNPFSLYPNTSNEEVVAALKEPNGIITSRIATADKDGAGWLALEQEVYLFGIIQSGDYGMAWGKDRILITKDAWETSKNILGDWVSAIGPSGIFREVKGVLS